MPTMRDLVDVGQAVWLDFLSKPFMDSGQLQDLIEGGLRGVTANPTILHKAFSGSADYDGEIRRMVAEGKSAQETFEALIFKFIGQAADLFRPVYEETFGADGFVSLEVNPAKAHDPEATIEEVIHLFTSLNQPNVMIKVPATFEGVPAIERLTCEGVNVNITLMFSTAQYDAVAEAYITGLEKRLEKGEDIASISSVASFFVSRVDTMVDKELEECGGDALSLRGKIAIANAKMAYSHYLGMFSGPRWEKLAAQGARAQRPLWASTSTKDPAYPDTMYIDNLIGPDTVNTMPLETLHAFLDHGSTKPVLTEGLRDARAYLSRLADQRINMAVITQRLLTEGLDSFAKSYNDLLDGITRKWREFGGQEKERQSAA
ncbi:MAG: transaldolase [Armatimonadota bacterium]